MFAHGHRLMCSYAQIRQRPSGAQENKTGTLILREEPDRVALIHFAGFESAGASEAPSLMTERRERQPLAKSRLPYVLISCHLNGSFFSWRSEQHIELSFAFVVSVH